MILINNELQDFAIRNITPVPHIETCQVDLSVGEVWFMTSKQEPRLLKDSRLTADVIPYEPDKNNMWRLRTGFPYQITTAEVVDIPNDIYPRLSPRRTTFASGLCVFLTNVSPGYKGKLSFTVIPMLGEVGVCGVHIEKGFRIISATFEKLEEGIVGYDGFWQGGRPEGTGGIPGRPM